MHLCDAAKEGRPVPSTLPVELVPPAQRRKRGSSLSISDDKQDHVTLQNNGMFILLNRSHNTNGCVFHYSICLKEKMNYFSYI